MDIANIIFKSEDLYKGSVYDNAKELLRALGTLLKTIIPQFIEWGTLKV